MEKLGCNHGLYHGISIKHETLPMVFYHQKSRTPGSWTWLILKWGCGDFLSHGSPSLTMVVSCWSKTKQFGYSWLGFGVLSILENLHETPMWYGIDPSVLRVFHIGEMIFSLLVVAIAPGVLDKNSSWNTRSFIKFGVWCPQDTRPGKHTKNYGKSASLIGKSTLNGPFQ